MIHRRRVVSSFVAALCLLGVAGSSTASAYTMSSVAGLGAARSYGIHCDGDYNWVRQNWPTIYTTTSVNQTVYVRSQLYRWTTSGWSLYRTGSWYSGVSNNQGRKSLGTFGGLPYYFALAGTPSTVAPTTGLAFTALPDGYYSTVEQYQVAGRQWNAQNYVESASEDYSSYYCAI